MVKKNLIKVFGIMLSVMFVLLCININYSAIFELNEIVHLTLHDLDSINTNNVFGNYVNASINEDIISVGGEKRHNTTLQIKLFGFLPIKSIDAVIEEKREVYLGGIPLGFSINTKGLIVVGENSISKSKKGKSPFRTGDIITKINNVVIEEASDIKNILSSTNGDKITINILRKGEEKEIIAFPSYDEELGEFKLGLWVRDDAQGIGTLTFVTKEGDFGALGHSINDYETGVEIPVKDGGIYLCNLVGINKAEKGKPGELRCLFSQTKNAEGNITKNTKCGVFGETGSEDIVDVNLTAEVGNRMLVKLGKAQIISSISGIRESYDIEIIKTNYQSLSGDKSFVFRVTDKRLINISGGIVQGMSGSPILQNGKIIGSVTHVFLNDATKGYGVYIDWMMENIS